MDALDETTLGEVKETFLKGWVIAESLGRVLKVGPLVAAGLIQRPQNCELELPVEFHEGIPFVACLPTAMIAESGAGVMRRSPASAFPEAA